jgi:hypothetical protein
MQRSRPMRKPTWIAAGVAVLSLLAAASCGGESGGMGTGGTGGGGGAGGAGGGPVVPCGSLTCTGGEVCVVQVDATIHHFCAPDPCAPKPLSCTCASSFSNPSEGCGAEYYCVSATDGQISCMPYPDAGSPD